MIYQLIGLVFFLVGSSHLLDWAEIPEKKFVEASQTYFSRISAIGFFKEIWFLGRTTFSVIVLVLLTSYDFILGLAGLSVFLVIVGVEQIVKLAVNRRRPFDVHASIQMLQPQQPKDASFPSGDSLRIWFLALIIPIAAGFNIYFLLAMILIALLVSLGRIVMGVHYPSDILAGAGLGILGAGTTIWIWQVFSLL